MKNKKIFSISMVKNEMDVIESFVRYNANIFDGMIILDNGSTDHTLKILKNLKNEGLPLFIIEDTDREYKQEIKSSKLLEMAVNEFKADVIVPLDADEFLISNHGNPREIIENIESSTYYLVKWKTYVPDFSKNVNEKFIPSKITMARDDSLEEYYKVVIPKELLKNYNVKLTMGNHDLVYDTQYKDSIKQNFNSNLRIAHFPIRSREQTISKIAIGWIYNLARVERTGSQNFHQKIIFDKLKENEEPSDEDVVNFAKKFALQNLPTKINLKEDPIDLTFCNNLEIKYTQNKVQPMSNILESCEWLSLSSANYKKESIIEIKRLKDKIESMSKEMNEFNQIKVAEEQKLKRKIEEYENSTSWTITAPLRKISAKIRSPSN